jgi:hypothetical protein
MPAKRIPRKTQVPCDINLRTWVLLEKRAEKKGQSVSRYVADHLVSFFCPKEVESIKEGFFNPG